MCPATGKDHDWELRTQPEPINDRYERCKGCGLTRKVEGERE